MLIKKNQTEVKRGIFCFGKSVKDPTVEVRLTNGFGNNLFQYVYARLIAEYHGSNLSLVIPKKYYAKSDLEKVGAVVEKRPMYRKFETVLVTDQNATRKYYGESFKNKNFKLTGYFEDFNLFENDIETIKLWFPDVEKKNLDDLVFHLRLGDRLFYKQTYHPDSIVKPEDYINAIKKFDFSKLHIVTDMHAWAPLTKESFSKQQWHVGGVGGREFNRRKKLYIDDLQIAVDYFNSIYFALNDFSPLVRCNYPVSEDFNFMRSFDKILFHNGTTAWWAAILSDASQVGVYGKWRPWKGDHNKNLSKVGLDSWFTWEQYRRIKQ